MYRVVPARTSSSANKIRRVSADYKYILYQSPPGNLYLILAMPRYFINDNSVHNEFSAQAFVLAAFGTLDNTVFSTRDTIGYNVATGQ